MWAIIETPEQLQLSYITLNNKWVEMTVTFYSATTQDVGVYVQKGSEQPTCTCGSSFFLGKVTALGVLCCFALLFV